MPDSDKPRSTLAAAYGVPDFVPVVSAVPAFKDKRGRITYLLPPAAQLEGKGLDGYIPASALAPLLNDFGKTLMSRLGAALDEEDTHA